MSSDNASQTPVHNPEQPIAAAASDCPPEKSKNQDKNEAKRKAKMEKFLAKQAAGKATTPDAAAAAAPKKEKEPKAAPKPKPAFVNTTPVGEKKDMTEPMADSYNPVAVESA
ncbi:valine--tRNA ligase, partial [Coemansia sp. S2]